MIGAVVRKTASAAIPPYQSLYRLRTAPFGADLSDAFFYIDPARVQALDMLQHLTQYSEELLLLSGESQVGKSALLEQYLQRAEEHWLTCYLDGNDGGDAGELFLKIAECFRMPMAGVAADALLPALQQHLNSLAEQHLAVLVVDDAHLLDDDALEVIALLAGLEGEHGRLVRVLLAAEPLLLERLQSERFVALPEPHRIELLPFDIEETGRYLKHRMAAAGYNGPELFTAKHIRRIHKQSGGLPGQINIFAHQQLMDLSQPSRGKGDLLTTSRNLLKYGAAAAAVAAAVMTMEQRVVSLVSAPEEGEAGQRPIVRMAEGSNENSVAMVIRGGESVQITCGAPSGIISSAAAAEMPPRQVESAPARLSPIITELPGPALEMEAEPAVIPEEQALPPAEAPEAVAAAEVPMTSAEPEVDVVMAAAPSAEPEPVAEEGAGESTPEVAMEQEVVPEAEEIPEPIAERPKIDHIEPMPVIGSDEEQVLRLIGEGFHPESSVAVAWAGKTKVLSADRVTVLDQAHVELRLVTGARDNNWAVQLTTPEGKRSNIVRFKVKAPEQPVAEVPEAAPEEPVAAAPVVVEKPKVRPEPKSGAALEGEVWLKGRNPGRLTLQLLASTDPKALEGFAQQHAIPGPVARYATQRDGQRLYILVQGDYADRAAADAARAALPKAVRDGGPWPRSFASVQGEIAVPMVREQGKAGQLRDEAWAWSQDPASYTVQLAAASSRDGLAAAAAQAGSAGDFAIVTTRRQGQPWYLLIAGSYPSRDAAHQAIANLPANLRRAGPWSRSFASLHDEMSQTAR